MRERGGIFVALVCNPPWSNISSLINFIILSMKSIGLCNERLFFRFFANNFRHKTTIFVYYQVKTCSLSLVQLISS